MEISRLTDNPYIFWPDFALWFKANPSIEGWIFLILFFGLALFLALPVSISRKGLALLILVPILHMTTCTSTIVGHERLRDQFQQEYKEGIRKFGDPPDELVNEIVTYGGDERFYYFQWAYLLMLLIPTVAILYVLRRAFALLIRIFVKVRQV